MPRWLKIIISSLINAVLNFGTAYMALLQVPGMESRADIPELALTVALVGSGLAFLKDAQTALSAYETTTPAPNLRSFTWPLILFFTLMSMVGCNSRTSS